MYFTNLVLHFSCIGTIRNGISMSHYVLFASEEFENPVGAYILGILLVITNITCALTNMI